MPDEIVDDTGDDNTPEDRGDVVVEDVVEDVVAKDDDKTDDDKVEDVDPLADQNVPYSRFKTQNSKLRDSEARVAELEAKLAAEPKEPAPAVVKDEPVVRDFAKEIDAAEARLFTAMEENDPKAQLAISKEIRAIERAEDRADYDARIAAAEAKADQSQEAVAQTTFENVLTHVEQQLPALDPASAEYDAHKFTMVQDLMRGYENQESSQDALSRAAAMVFPESAFSQDFLGKEPVAPVADADADAGADKDAAPARGIKEKIAAAAATPPNLSDAGGANSDEAGLRSEIDPTKLTDEEFNALPIETLRRLRGDTVAA